MSEQTLTDSEQPTDDQALPDTPDSHEEGDSAPATNPSNFEGFEGELVWMDPADLIVGVNVRKDAALTKEFLEDIAANGVRTPITARRDPDGHLVVRTGQRRTLAAVEARRRVPVFVEPEMHREDDATATIDRLVDQLSENHHRAKTPDSDQVVAHQQLLELGLSAGQIAKRTHLNRREAKTLRAVASSPVAAGMLQRHDQLDLTHAAAIAEFDQGSDTDTDTVAALVAAATKKPEQFAHVLQRARDEREEVRLLTTARAQLRVQGVRILSEDPDEPDTVYANGEATGLSRLRASHDTPTTENLTAEAHASCPGHAATLRIWRSYGAKASKVEVDYFCTDPATYGHVERYTRSEDSKPKLRDLPPEQAEQARQERRRVIRLNRAWGSAEKVRIEWITALLQRKSPPTDAALFIAAVLAHGGHPLRKAAETGNPMACTLLGLPEPKGYYGASSNPIAGLLDTASAARATQLSLAVMLGAIEQSLGKHSWRNINADTTRYLTALRSWGYSLSEVETLAAGETPVPDEPDPDTPLE